MNKLWIEWVQEDDRTRWRGVVFRAHSARGKEAEWVVQGGFLGEPLVLAGLLRHRSDLRGSAEAQSVRRPQDETGV